MQITWPDRTDNNVQKPNAKQSTPVAATSQATGQPAKEQQLAGQAYTLLEPAQLVLDKHLKMIISIITMRGTSRAAIQRRAQDSQRAM